MAVENLRMKFLAFNLDFRHLSPDPVGSRRPAQAGVKEMLLRLILETCSTDQRPLSSVRFGDICCASQGYEI